MGIFPFDEMSPLGRVQSMDTANVIVCVEDPAQLSQLQVNHLVAIRSSKTGQALFGEAGGFFGKLSRFVQRLQTKATDTRLNFMFADNEEFLTFHYIEACASVSCLRQAGVAE